MKIFSAVTRVGLICSTFLHATHTNAKVIHRGVSLSVNDLPYYVHPQVAEKLAACSLPPTNTSKSGYVPVTVFDLDPDQVSAHGLRTAIGSYLAKDDVFNRGFLEGIYIRSTNLSAQHMADVNANDFDASFVSFLDSKVATVPHGPYIFSSLTGALHIPYRLYSDTQGAFHQGVIPASNRSYAALPAAVPGASAMTIAVPSRLYYSPTADRPLSGVRLGVKDIYDLKGIKTGGGSRAYYNLYPPANASAVILQRLVDAGAIVVGKMKTTQFAAPENARDAVDYQAPFNPRADGYQEPGSSSSGPGAGIGSYEWLDLALGSDTGGSIRVPAEDNGVFGNRPTWGVGNLTNVISLSPQMDTPGFLVRDPKLWSTACHVAYDGLDAGYHRYPQKILTYNVPVESSTVITTGQKVVLDFVHKLSRFLSATITPYNYTSEWTSTRPAGTPAILDDLTATVWATLSAQEQIESLKIPFFREYATKFGNRAPFVNPSTNGSWSWKSTVPNEVDQALTNKTIFAEWWNSVALPPNSESCSDALFIYVFKEATPEYRQLSAATIGPPGLPGVLLGMNAGFIAPLTGTPDFAVTVGEVNFTSIVTLHEESLPVGVRIMAAKGCDGMLLDLVNDLADNGILPTVKTGSKISGGPIFL